MIFAAYYLCLGTLFLFLFLTFNKRCLTPALIRPLTLLILGGSLSSAYFFFIQCVVLKKYQSIKVILFNWIPLGYFTSEWAISFDVLTITMLVVIFSVSSLVHLYSFMYMRTDPNFIQFIAYLALFTFFMTALVVSNDFFQLFFGWEGVGLASYLLISFWKTRLEANKSAVKAMLYNKIGDCGLLLGMALLLFVTKTLNFDSLNILVYYFKDIELLILGYPVNVLSLACWSLLLGVMGKSAQFGLHAWLPDAMEGPTPVSALIHAATMVTAGVYLLIKCAFLYQLFPEILNWIAVLGAFTSFFAGSIGVAQYDLKKVIAYSTCSQLGYMVMACGLGNYNGALFHLFNHAFFKAALFLSAGCLIHYYKGEQDMRRMGLNLNLSFLALVMFISNMSLIGVPYLSGFYSKDFILEASGTMWLWASPFCWMLAYSSIFFTTFYSFRSWHLSFLANNYWVPRGLTSYSFHFELDFPLLFLSFFSIFSGVIFGPFFLNWSNHLLTEILNLKTLTTLNHFCTEFFYEPTILVVDCNLDYFDEMALWSIFEALNFELLGIHSETKSLVFFKNPLSLDLPLLIIASTGSFYTVFYCIWHFWSLSKWLIEKTNPFFVFLNKKWFFDDLVSELSFASFRLSLNVLYYNFDRGVFELYGPTGISRIMLFLNRQIEILQKGWLYLYWRYTFLWSSVLILSTLFCLLFVYN